MDIRQALRGNRRAPMGRAPSRPGVRVEPANDTMRRLLKHPSAGGFRASGSVEWPNDRFTKRRLLDHSIQLVERPAAEQPPAEAKPGEQPAAEQPPTDLPAQPLPQARTSRQARLSDQNKSE
jgi:hypothetical protein